MAPLTGRTDFHGQIWFFSVCFQCCSSCLTFVTGLQFTGGDGITGPTSRGWGSDTLHFVVWFVWNAPIFNFLLHQRIWHHLFGLVQGSDLLNVVVWVVWYFPKKFTSFTPENLTPFVFLFYLSSGCFTLISLICLFLCRAVFIKLFLRGFSQTLWLLEGKGEYAKVWQRVTGGGNKTAS